MLELLWATVAVLVLAVACMIPYLCWTRQDVFFLENNKKCMQQDLGHLRKDVDTVMSELRLKFGKYFLNPKWVRGRVNVVPGSTACMVAEDHPIVTHPRMVRLPEMGQVNLDGEQWLWFTTRSTMEVLALKYGI